MKKNIIILSLAALSLTGCGVMKNYDREEVAQPIDIETLYGDAEIQYKDAILDR
mgnify:CR=1 FL=1